METKMIKVPFDVELAKKITEKSVDGKIVTRDGSNARILCFDRKGTQMPIIALVEIKDGEEDYFSYYENGRYDIIHNSKDLMLEIPKYMTFKDGDILYCKGVYNWIFIYRSNGGDKTSCYATVMDDKSSAVFLGLCVMSDEEVKDLRLATEEEKKQIIDILKASKEPKAKEYLKRFFGIEVKQEYEFKPFDKVLVRDGNKEKWKADLFSYKTENNVFSYMCVSDSYKDCIPYNEQTAHLLGTTENYE